MQLKDLNAATRQCKKELPLCKSAHQMPPSYIPLTRLRMNASYLKKGSILHRPGKCPPQPRPVRTPAKSALDIQLVGEGVSTTQPDRARHEGKDGSQERKKGSRENRI